MKFQTVRAGWWGRGRSAEGERRKWNGVGAGDENIDGTSGRCASGLNTPARGERVTRGKSGGKNEGAEGRKLR